MTNSIGLIAYRIAGARGQHLARPSRQLVEPRSRAWNWTTTTARETPSDERIGLPHPTLRLASATTVRHVQPVNLTPFLCLALAAWSGITSARDNGCPSLDGRYHLSGEDHVVEVALAALASPREVSRRSAIALHGPSGGELVVALRGDLSSDWPMDGGVRLREGSDFRCDAAGVHLLREARTQRWRGEDDSRYSGTATVSLSRPRDGGLQLRVRFEGSQRITVYSYDSATASVPKPFSSRRFDESLYWPVWSDADDRIRRPPAPEPAPVQALRKQLDGQLLGNVQMGTPTAVADGMLVRFTAARSGDVIAFEDRLRAAGIRYESREAPVWSNNRYEMAFLVDLSGSGSSLPSPLRVEHELRRLAPPLADLLALRSDGDVYIARLRLVDSPRPDALLARLRQHSSLFAEIALLSDPAVPAGELQLTLRAR